MLTIPTVPANVGGAAVLRMKQPDAAAGDRHVPRAHADGAVDRHRPGADIPPSSIRVRVLNGSGAEGQAREVGKALGDIGFNVAGLGQASSFRFDDTVITDGPGQRDKGLAAAAQDPGWLQQLKEDPTLRSIDVVVTTGGNYGGVAGATSTTVKPGATTTTAKPGAKATTTTAPAQTGPQC